jgi:hypothetical protein
MGNAMRGIISQEDQLEVRDVSRNGSALTPFGVEMGIKRIDYPNTLHGPFQYGKWLSKAE